MPNDTRRRTALFAVGVLLPVPVLAGCGSDETDAKPVAAVQDVAPAPLDKLRDGGTLRWALDAAPPTFNAFQADADAGTERITGAVLPSLFTLDSQGRPHRNPDYLRSAEVVRRAPEQVVVYRLNPDAVWSDGRRIGVADFTAQWKALRGADNRFWTARNAGYDRIAKIAAGEKKGEVKVTFAKPYADWASLFSPLYPRSVMGSPTGFNDRARKELKVTAGPFRIRSKGAKAVTLVRNPRWWGDRARLDRIVFRAVPRDRRAAALAAGELDLAETDAVTAARILEAGDPRGKDTGRTPAAALRAWAGRNGSPSMRAEYAKERSELAALRRLTVRKALEPAYTQLALNGTAGPLTDERVRRAVAGAIDREKLAQAVLAPLGLPPEPLGSHLLMRTQAGYRDGSGALGDRDPQAAQAALADAGWQEGGTKRTPESERRQEARAEAKREAKAEAQQHAGTKPRPAAGQGPDADAGRDHPRQARPQSTPVRTKNGKPLTLRFVLPDGPGSAPLRAVGDRIARMLAGIGVGTEIVKVRNASYFSDHIASGEFDLALYSWPATAFPATDARPVYAKPQPAADGSLVVEQNYSRVGTDQIDQLFEKAAAELDEGAARGLVGRADARIWAAAGSIPLYQRPELVAAGKSLANAGAFGFGTPRYQDIGFRK
ncbi:ABC transporter family substrate-binding protein [Streptomyces sp. P1-3]|uniref:ABC transporter family substrate-binding protein n=1 Tax=Streptomyces sp. P1-3 TaxID=3421658 RepID=UPI003D3641D3